MSFVIAILSDLIGRQHEVAIDDYADRKPGTDRDGRLDVEITTYHLLVGLVEVGLASVDPQGRFSLGERLLGFGGDAGARIPAIFRPTIDGVARATDGDAEGFWSDVVQDIETRCVVRE